MKKKLGNDVEFQITVTRLGIAEDFANATDILVKVYQHNGNCGYVVASSERTNNVFDVYLLADNLSLGTYDCDISYKLPDTNSPTGTRSCSSSYRSVFTVVKNTEDEDDEGQGIIINVGYVKDGVNGLNGPEGKSAYESYLEKTGDNPPLTYVEWALLLPELKSQIEDLKIDINTLKSEADAVQEYDSFLVFPNVGASGIIFIDTTENVSYRWDEDLLKYYKINAIEIDIIDGNLN